MKLDTWQGVVLDRTYPAELVSRWLQQELGCAPALGVHRNGQCGRCPRPRP